MLPPNSHRQWDIRSMSEEKQLKLQKIKELTDILKDTEKNLTTCEEILSSYVKKRLKNRREEIQRRAQLESKMTEILDNLRTRLSVE